MTPDAPTPRPTRDGHERPRRVRFATLATLAVLALAATVGGVSGVSGVGGVGATSTVQDDPAVRITDASVDPGGTATVRVVLTSAPEGLAGYELVVSIGSGDVATIAGANYTDAFGLTTEPAVSEDGRTIRLEAADLGGNVQAGATDVTLVTVELRGESAGRARADARPVQFDADGGVRMNVSVEAGSVAVGEPEPTASPTAEPTATPTEGAATTGGSASAETTRAADGDTATSTLTSTTSGRGNLPLAGFGVAALAFVLVAMVLARRR